MTDIMSALQRKALAVVGRFGDDASMRSNRAREYARCTAVLLEDRRLPGAEAAFDQALTNGLAAIVAHQWPGHELHPSGQVKSAARLLDVISEKARAALIPNGAFVILLMPEDAVPSEQVLIHVATLQTGINETQPVRHARGHGNLAHQHVEALRLLNDHPALCSLDEQLGEGEWAREQVRDRYRWAEAEEYLALIGDEEAQRRSTMAGEYLPAKPKHRLTDPGLHECPVCGYEALRAHGFDDFGMGVAYGMCLVCSYQRSYAVAVDQGRDERIYMMVNAPD